MLDKKFWADYFEVYDTLNLIIPYRELLNDICDELDIKEGDKILEAGSGTGNLALEMKKRGADVVGIDNVEEAMQKHRDKDEVAVAIHADLTEELPFPDSYFDKVCSNNVIYAIPRDNRDYLMREFYRILKPGGRIAISNVHEGFKPVKIYIDHIKKDFKKGGALKVIKDIVVMSPPTIKMFQYNTRIRKENKSGDYDFMEFDEQIKLLKKNGFSNISENKKVYSNQAILNSAIKK